MIDDDDDDESFCSVVASFVSLNVIRIASHTFPPFIKQPFLLCGYLLVHTLRFS